MQVPAQPGELARRPSRDASTSPAEGTSQEAQPGVALWPMRARRFPGPAGIEGSGPAGKGCSGPAGIGGVGPAGLQVYSGLGCYVLAREAIIRPNLAVKLLFNNHAHINHLYNIYISHNK
jgi:hypothetical protein